MKSFYTAHAYIGWLLYEVRQEGKGMGRVDCKREGV